MKEQDADARDAGVQGASARRRAQRNPSVGGLTITQIRDDGTPVNCFISDGMLRLMRLTKAQWDARDPEAIDARVHPDDAGQVRALYTGLKKNGQTGSASYRLACADGGYTWISVAATCAVENGETCIYAVHTDITRQKEREQREQDASKQLASVLGGVTCGICAYEYLEAAQRARIVFANQSYYALLGYTREQFDREVGDNTLQLVYPDDLPGLISRIRTAFQTGATQVLDYRCIKRNREIIWVTIKTQPTDIFGSAQRVLLCETVDITSRKRMEDERASMLEQITFLNHAAGDLLSGMDADSAVDVGLWDILNYFGGQRAYVFEFDAKKRTACNTYEVCAPGTEPAKAILQEIPYADFAAWFDLFERDGYIAISDVSVLGKERAAERELLKIQRIASLIVVPLKDHGTIVGMMGVDDPAKNVDQVPRLQAIGDYISVMLSRRDMTQELRDNNLRMKAMMNDTPGGFVQMVIHVDNGITPAFINDGFCQMLGMTQAETHELFDQDAYAGAHPDDRLRVSELLRETIEKRAAATTRVRLRTGGGSYITAEAHYRVWEKHDGELFLNGYYRDISDRVADEEEYRRNMAFRDAADKNAIGSYHLNVTQNIIDDGVSSEPAIQALGESSTIDEFLIRSAPMHRESEHREFAAVFSRKAMLGAMAQGKNKITLEHALYLSPEKTRWICTAADLFKNPETEDVEGFIYTRDLTEEHLLHQMMRTVVNIGYDFILVICVRTRTYRTFIANSGIVTAFKETGVYDEEHTLRGLLTIIHPDDREATLASMQLENLTSQLMHASCSEFSYRVVADGQLKHKRCTFSYLDEDRDYIILSRMDETEAVQQMHAALEEAKSASRAKTTFLSNMSHEIRTPMNAIIGLTQLTLDDKSLGAQARSNLVSIRDSSDYLLNIINDILDMSRIESGKFTLNCEWVPVNEIMNQCVQMMLPAMEKKHIAFDYPSDARTSGFECYVDALKTKRMIMNLLNNACKFTDEGGHIRLSFQSKRCDAQTSTDYILIEDDGCGMSEEFLGRIFTPFAQERNACSGSIQGTGLGLALARETARAMGGDITVESRLGAGSKFTVEFPYRYRKCDPKRPAAKAKPGRAHTGLKGKRILLCEDNPLNAVIAKKLLEKCGCETDTVENGRLGVARFCASEPGTYDAILMDIRMPVMDGLAAARAIRALARPDAATVPILAMSANAFAEDVQKSLEAGMNAHIAKPVEPQKLYQTLIELIG